MINKFLILHAGKRNLATTLFLVAITFLTVINVYAGPSERRIIVGGVENVRIDEVDAVITAKLDTGAKTSSINAKIIEQADEYVVFEIVFKDKEIERVKLKKKIERIVRIKRKNSNDGGGDEDNSKTIRRPVVIMEFCIAGQLIECEVNLANRSNLKHDLLIGRNMLEKGQLVVDVSKSFTTNPNCIVED